MAVATCHEDRTGQALQRIIIHNFYPVAPDALWDLATDYCVLSAVMKGMVRFIGLPKTRVEKGQNLEIEVSLLGWLPKRPYRINVTECDPSSFTIRTNEQGNGIKRWRHTTVITGYMNESYWIDVVEVEAGWLTIPATLWARFIYSMRHPRRRRLLGL